MSSYTDRVTHRSVVGDVVHAVERASLGTQSQNQCKHAPDHAALIAGQTVSAGRVLDSQKVEQWSLSAVYVGGVASFSAALNGEYVRVAPDYDGRPHFRKRDGTKHLFYSMRLREWQIARRPGRGGGVFASCSDTEGSDPTKLQATWVVGATADRNMRVQRSPPPRNLFVSYLGAHIPDFEGEYRLLPEQFTSDLPYPTLVYAKASQPKACATQRTTPGCPIGFFLRRLAAEWSFTVTHSAPDSNNPEQERVVATCPVDLLRADLLDPLCFSNDTQSDRLLQPTSSLTRPHVSRSLRISIVASCRSRVPTSVEIGETSHHAESLAGASAAGQTIALGARGEYHRAADYDGRPRYSKPDESMFLFYSNNLGGWQLSSMLGRGSGLFHPGVQSCSPHRLRGPWQVIDDKQGVPRPVHLKIIPAPPSQGLEVVSPLIHAGSTAVGQKVNNHYVFAGFKAGRPAYTTGSRQNTERIGFNMSLPWTGVYFEPAANEWQLLRDGRVLAESNSGADVYQPEWVVRWHLVKDGICTGAIPSLQISVEQPGPSMLLVHGRKGRVTPDINGEYVRATRNFHGRAAYMKPDGSKHLYYSPRHAEWQIAKQQDDPAGILAYCPDALARDPSRLGPRWVVGLREDPRVQILEWAPVHTVTIDSGGVFLDGEFRVVGRLHQRPVYHLFRSSSQRSAAADNAAFIARRHGAILIRYSAMDLAWIFVLVGPPVRLDGAGKVLAYAVEHSDAYRLEDVNLTWRMLPRNMWDASAQPAERISRDSRPIQLSIRTVMEATRSLSISVGARVPGALISGTYERDNADADGRPAYRRISAPSGSKADVMLRLMYSNFHGAWRILRVSGERIPHPAPPTPANRKSALDRILKMSADDVQERDDSGTSLMEDMEEREVAYCPDVRALRPELATGPWEIANGTQVVEETLVFVAAAVVTWRASSLVTSVCLVVLATTMLTM